MSREQLLRMVATVGALSALVLTAMPAAGGAPAADGAAATVGMTNTLEFTPTHVTVTVGDTVLWRNNSDLVHTVTADPQLASDPDHVALPDGASPFNSGSMNPGDTYRHTFGVPGEYTYFCIPHEAAGMIGHVTVVPEG